MEKIKEEYSQKMEKIIKENQSILSKYNDINNKYEVLIDEIKKYKEER